MAIHERFMKLINSAKREGAPERELPEPPPPPDPDAEIMAALAGWTSDERGVKVFVPWLEKEMERAIQQAHQGRLIHAESSYALGFEAAMRLVRDRFLKWAKGGQSA